ncbi:hypothetical protein C8D87_108152 [Lentzea atacamensis]|uniref:Membrane-associated oxidoreductase n=1 Tax=Lentzea atacamensis TaxID=531938 RepID=A0ABX9E341_9PSEU|nr:hypothetical protein [Lentzea atacamensis]RAS62331.1 hypothetical protein C8D87_108152 [Lentzea atacamensis]
MEITGDEIRRLLTEADDLDPSGLRVVGAHIEGQLDLRDLVVKRPLVLRDCTTEQPVLLSRAHFSQLDLEGLVAPSIRARGLTVDHDLHLSSARLSGDESIYALHMRIGGSVYLDDGFQAAGSVVLSGSRVAGVISCRGARFDSTLHLVDVQVGDAIFLSHGCRASSDGTHAAVRMRGARVDGQIVLRDGRFTSPAVAVDLRHVKVGKDLLMPFEGIEGSVQLEGLVYEGLPRDATVDEWLSLLATRTPYYSTQPWVQLAAAHQAAGHERDVRRIRVAAQRDLRRRGQLSRWGRIWHLIRGLTIGHGYRPALALLWLAGVLAVSVAVVLASGAVRCSVVEQVGYALNVATPLVKVDAARCTVDTASGAGQFVLASTWLLQILAWAFATLFVAGFTGLVRRNA